MNVLFIQVKRGVLLLVITTLMLGTTSCDQNSLQSHEENGVNAAILIDQTDSSFISRIDAETITETLFKKSKIDFEDIYDGSITIQVLNLNQMIVSESSKVTLPPSEGIMQIHKHRKHDQQKFKEDLIIVIDKVKDKITTQPSSKLFTPIVRQLDALAAQKGKKVCFIFSDLLENSDEISFYKASPSEIEQHISKRLAKCKNDLSGLQVWCFFQPKSKREDKLFDVVRQAFEKVLTSHNAYFKHLPNL